MYTKVYRKGQMEKQNKEEVWCFRPDPELAKVLEEYCQSWGKSHSFVQDYLIRSAVQDKLPIYLRTFEIKKDNKTKRSNDG